MYKKFLSILLCLCLVCAAGMATAETTDETDLNYATEHEPARTVEEAPGSVDGNNVYTSTAEVTVTVEEEKNDREPPEYYVEIVWGAMYFGYGALEEGYKMWNTETHEYEYQDKDGQAAEVGWFLINEETLDDEYNEGENGVAWVHGNGIETSQAHVLIFNHSNRAVNVDANIMDEAAYDEDMDAIMEPITEPAVSTVDVTMDGEQKATALLPRGVHQNENIAPDTRWLPETTIGFVVNMQGDGSGLPDTKTLVAKLNITISEADAVTEDEEYSGPETEEIGADAGTDTGADTGDETTGG